MAHPNIAIVGGGPGGLTLARILHLHGLSAAVFEREPASGARPQGGTLDLHASTGQAALARAGLTDRFSEIARYEDQGTRLYDRYGTLLYDDLHAADQGDRPEVDRTALRELLLESLPPEVIHWNCTLQKVHSRNDGRYDLHFSDDLIRTFDLVIGADGAWSRVRPLVSSYEPQYTGVTFVEFSLDDVDRRHPFLSRLIGRGKISVEGDGRGIIAQRNAHAHIRCYAMFRVPDHWAERRIDFSDPGTARLNLAEQFAGWSPDFLRLIECSNDNLSPRPLHALPVGHHWPNRAGVTLIGDAAHLMSPFGGEGVNAAMFDAAELGRLLAGVQDWRNAVQVYETEMFKRVREPAKRAAEAVASKLSHDGLELALEHLERHKPLETPRRHVLLHASG